MNDPYILGIDCGTQSIRALIFDKRGNLIVKKKIEYKPYFSPQPGWAEQDPDVYWESLCLACQELKSEYPSDWEKIIGVSLTTFRDSVVNVDENGNVLRPAIIWLDQRMAQCNEHFPNIHNLMTSAVGLKERINNFRKKFKWQWIKENQPEIHKKTHKYLFISGYLTYKLTGNFYDSVAAQIGHIPYDYKRFTWAKSYDIKSSVFPIEREKLPELKNPGEILGNINKEISEVTGIKEGIPVIAAGSDKGCETLGTGCFDLKKGNISLGSAVTIQTTADRYFEIYKFTPPYPAVIPGCYNPEVMILRGYWMISWFKNEFAMKEVQEAKKLNVSPESLLNKRLGEIPPGSHGLLLQPYWGAEIKDPEAKGAIIGFSDVHTRVHIYRAIIEGINYALLEGIERIEKKSKVKIEEITVSGGGSQSDAICQITADMLNRPVCRAQTYETSGLGAAIVGFVGIGIYKSYEEAVNEMVHYKDVFKPNKENVEIYSNLYERVYKKLYPRLKKLYKEIIDITVGNR